MHKEDFQHYAHVLGMLSTKGGFTKLGNSPLFTTQTSVDDFTILSLLMFFTWSSRSFLTQIFLILGGLLDRKSVV